MTALYVAFEGGEGSGKSTQAALLGQRLDALVTREPGATPLGQALRRLLLDPDQATVSPRAEALMMAADRAAHVEELVLPALASGRHVVTDRSAFSSLAYQGGGRELGVATIQQLNDWAIGQRWPDLVFLLDASTSTLQRRLDRPLDRLEQEADSFHQRVSATFRALAAEDPDRWHVIAADETIEAVAEAVWQRVALDLGQRQGDAR